MQKMYSLILRFKIIINLSETCSIKIFMVLIFYQSGNSDCLHSQNCKISQKTKAEKLGKIQNRKLKAN